MTDFRPGDHRVVVPRERSIGSWVFVGLGLFVLAGSAWVYHFRPQWAAYLFDLAGRSRYVKPLVDDAALTALYQKYGMAPLDASVASAPNVNSLLASLRKEPCDKQTVFEASRAIEDLRAIRGAAEMLNGFADACPDGSNERYRASELYYLLADYETAVKLSSDVIDHKPDAQFPYFVRAKSEQSLKQYASAIEDYATLIRLLPDTKSIVSEVFTRMSDSYEKLGRLCEAIGPIQTYIALDNEKRSTPPLLKRIATLAAQGNCAQVYAKGIARIARRPNGVTMTRVEINGVEGTFIVDTGASFVTLTPGFAKKIKLQALGTGPLELRTANGAISANLATIDSVKLDGLSASSVPAIVASKSVADGVDGLLGMSFLGRFNVAIGDRDIQLKAKTLGE
jgi:clan AA aspartic protease (TIGR02281 family)